MIKEIDNTLLNFNQNNLWLLNFCLGFIMFGVALDLKTENFKELFRQPKNLAIGVLSQFFLLPFLTWLLVLIIQPPASMALGMILVAACPGGNISNFITAQAKGNVELSIGLTAFSTGLALFMTPFNFAFWGALYAPAQNILTNISLDPLKMLESILVLTGLPVLLGMLFNRFLPQLKSKIVKPVKLLSIIIFILFVVLAFASNFDTFLKYIGYIALFVFLHNLIALAGGFSLGKIFNLDLKSVKTITIETGIQNSGLGLVLIFNFFNGLGGMALIAAWWGIWHIVSGGILAWFWSRK